MDKLFQSQQNIDDTYYFIKLLYFFHPMKHPLPPFFVAQND